MIKDTELQNHSIGCLNTSINPLSLSLSLSSEAKEEACEVGVLFGVEGTKPNPLEPSMLTCCLPCHPITSRESNLPCGIGPSSHQNYSH